MNLEISRDESESAGVSIIMPVKNMSKTIVTSILSVQHQTWQEWELLVVDDGTTDDSILLAADLGRTDSRIRIITNEGEKGIGSARNLGLKNANHRFIAFLDADDLWLPHKLEIQIRFMLKYKIHFTYTTYYTITKSGDLSTYVNSISRSVNYNSLLSRRPIATSSVMIDTAGLPGCEFPNLKRAQDLACWLRLLKGIDAAHLVRDPGAALLYRRGGWLTNLRNSIRGFRATLDVYKNILGIGRISRTRKVLQYAWNNSCRNLFHFQKNLKFTCVRHEAAPYNAFLTIRMPYPPLGGDRLRAYHMLKGLSRVGQVRILCYSTTPLASEDVLSALWDGHDLVAFRLSRVPTVLRAGLALLGRMPLQVRMFHSRSACRFLSPHVRDARIVFSMLIRTAPMALLGKGMKIIDFTDSIGLHYRDAVGHTRSLFWSLIYRLEGPRVLAYERHLVGRFDYAFLVNHKECEYMNNPEKVKWITNGVNPQLLLRPLYQGDAEPRVCYLGKMDYRPNIDACIWFINHVMPLLPEQITFLIIGPKPTSELIKAAGASGGRVVLAGFLDDPYEVMQRSLAVVAPLQTGGGVQNKILEAMALGCPVMATSRAASAIDLSADSDCMLVLDSPDEYAEAIRKGIDSPEFLRGLGPRARSVIEGKVQWRDIYSKIEGICHGS